MLKRTILSKSLLIAFSGTAAAMAGGAAFAQQADQAPVKLERVEVTGSAIKRIDVETAVPITILKFDDLKKEGIVTVEQVLNLIAGNQALQGTSQSVGASTGGASFANLRGLGQNKTLVLLNGRRIANNSFDGSAPDLNMIPFAELERVEVLRDGASALYGSDAIGGVINFITKKDLTGGSITLGADVPQHSGGKSTNANIGFGFGDLAKDRYNVMGFVDFQKQDAISAPQRPFGSTGLVPSQGIARSSGTPDPANYSQTSTTVRAIDPATGLPAVDKNGAPIFKTFSANPSAPNCNAPFGFSSGTKCRYDFPRWVDLIPATQRTSAMLQGTFALTDDTQIRAEYFITQDNNKTAIAPVPYAALSMNPGTAFFPGNGITPAPSNFAIEQAPINVQWRTAALGARTDSSDNTQQRFVLSLDGAAAGWDYTVGAAYNQNRVVESLTGGYSNGNIITAGVLNGTLNPFGAQSAAGAAVLNGSLATGTLLTGRGTVSSLDAHASREVGDWLGAGRQVALAVGAELRHENFSFKANAPFAAIVVASTGVDPGTDSVGSRNVYATYAELNVPITKKLEITASARYDKYSDFGSTVNPKLSFRFQPIDQVLFRGSASTGFRAPSLYDLHAPLIYTNTPNAWDDPLAGCDANGNPTNAGFLPTACGQQFMGASAGNPNLKPEKSKNLTFGLVLEPVKDLTVGLDFWWIRLTDAISFLPDTTIFGDPAKFASLFVRNAAGQLSFDGTQCPGANCGYVLQAQNNLGGVNTNGIDLSASYRLRTAIAGTFNFTLNGTYVSKYEYQTEPGGPWIQNVGIYSGNGPIFRWQQTANVQWNYGAVGLGITNRYKSGYVDQNDPNQVAACCTNHRVDAYSVWDVNGSWAVTKAFSLVAGVRNVLDTNPPFSNQGATFQVGYDPRFSDPTGRAYYVRGTYSF